MSRRQIISMDPTDLSSMRRQSSAPIDNLRRQLRDLAEIRAPAEAEEPVLAPVIRQAVFAWLAEIRAGNELEAFGMKPRSTALLVGPPGTGKTTLAHHMAARLGIPMVIVGTENLNRSYFGESDQAVGKLFAVLAASETPCLLFMDEIDGLAGNRSQNKGGGADNARSSMLGVLLRKVEEYQGYWIGATNRPNDIDPAFWRRIHMQMLVDLPGLDERFAILRRYGLPLEFEDDDIDLLADVTEGTSPALLRGLMEGIKRALVIWPRIGRSADSAEAVIAAVVATLSPPPEMHTPELWRNPAVAATIGWPPRMPGSDT